MARSTAGTSPTPTTPGAPNATALKPIAQRWPRRSSMYHWSARRRALCSQCWWGVLGLQCRSGRHLESDQWVARHLAHAELFHCRRGYGERPALLEQIQFCYRGAEPAPDSRGRFRMNTDWQFAAYNSINASVPIIRNESLILYPARRFSSALATCRPQSPIINQVHQTGRWVWDAAHHCPILYRGPRHAAQGAENIDRMGRKR